jgi:transcriptional regulator with XRE-family HTH domain
VQKTKNECGHKIKKLREDKLLSQNELALQLDISQTTLHNIESGHSQKIDFLLMDKVCKIFDKDFDYFVNDKVVTNNVKENNGQISCENFTINNHYPELLLEELRKLITDKDEQITLLKNLLEKKGIILWHTYFEAME